MMIVVHPFSFLAERAHLLVSDLNILS